MAPAVQYDDALAVAGPSPSQGSVPATEHAARPEVTSPPVKSEPVKSPVKPAAKPKRSKGNVTALSQIRIVGLQSAVDMSDGAGLQAELDRLWSRFSASDTLQNNVKWGEGDIYVYAHYSKFSKYGADATLTIGYDEKQLNFQTPGKVSLIPAGEYQLTRLRSAEDVLAQWSTVEFPVTAVVERYRLDSAGDIVSREFLVAE